MKVTLKFLFLFLIIFGNIKHLSAENTENQTELLYKQLSLFGNVLEQVRQTYVDQPEAQDLIDAALKGMLSSLDPHSSYLSPEPFKEMQTRTKGSFGGLGIEVTMEHGLVKVIAPIDGTPADQAGILPNDIISKVGDKAIMGLTLSQAVEIMRGPHGTKATLTVIRESLEKPITITITRDIIKIKAVRYKMIGEKQNIAYIRLTTFNNNTTKNLYKAVQTIKPKITDAFVGYIIDLRNNPGGLLTQAIRVSNSFLDAGEIVSTRARDSKNNIRYHAKKGQLFGNYPILVLINGGSASASEIVAGALQDHHRALIAGTQSFGKGSVQTIIPLPNKGALKLTTARYYTPSGESIQAKGITPDIIIEQTLPEDMKRLTAMRESQLAGHLQADKQKKPEKKVLTKSSIAYVPRDIEKDTQLKDAMKIMLDLKESQTRLHKRIRNEP